MLSDRFGVFIGYDKSKIDTLSMLQCVEISTNTSSVLQPYLFHVHGRLFLKFLMLNYVIESVNWSHLKI